MAHWVNNVAYGVDFRRKEEKPSERSLEQMAAEVLSDCMSFSPEAIIYESSIGYVAPKDDPA